MAAWLVNVCCRHLVNGTACWHMTLTGRKAVRPVWQQLLRLRACRMHPHCTATLQCLHCNIHHQLASSRTNSAATPVAVLLQAMQCPKQWLMPLRAAQAPTLWQAHSRPHRQQQLAAARVQQMQQRLQRRVCWCRLLHWTRSARAFYWPMALQ